MRSLLLRLEAHFLLFSQQNFEVVDEILACVEMRSWFPCLRLELPLDEIFVFAFAWIHSFGHDFLNRSFFDDARDGIGSANQAVSSARKKKSNENAVGGSSRATYGFGEMIILSFCSCEIIGRDAGTTRLTTCPTGVVLTIGFSGVSVLVIFTGVSCKTPLPNCKMRSVSDQTW